MWSLKAGCLPFYNLLYYYDSIFQKLVLCQKVLMYLDFLWTERKTETPIGFKRKNKNFRDFRVSDLALYPRLKTQKSRKFRLPWITTLIIIQDLKIPRKSIETKTNRFQYDLEQKGKFPRFPIFRFCSILKMENSEISENSLLIQILTV